MQGRIRVFFLALCDLVCISIAWTVAATVHVLCKHGCDGIWCNLSYWFNFWPVIFAFPLINLFFRLYHGRGTYPSMPVSEVEELRRLVSSALVTHVLVLAFLAVAKKSDAMANGLLMLSFLFTGFGAQPLRYVVRFALARLGWGQIPCLVIGEGAAAARLETTFATSSYYGFRILRKFGQGELADLLACAGDRNVRHLFACYSDDRLFKASFPELQRQFTFIEYLPTADSFPSSGAQVVQVGGLGGLEMTNPRQLKMLTLEKSIVDRTLALLIFLVASPLFLVVPLLIRLTSPGPVFYKARRLGKKGRTIYVWKFRSMYADADRRLKSMLDSDPALKAEYEKDFKLKDDPRITPLGKFLRKTSIDELPQLFNVFTHDMALIGPRPIVENEVAKYGRAYEIFSSVKPGITGLWQASGRNDCSYEERVALDVHYILNWSPWMDLWIVFRTVAAVLKMKGSY